MPITNANIKGYIKAYLKLHYDDKGHKLALGRQRIISGLPSDLKNKKIGDWDVSNVTNMEELFHNMKDFNEDISKWNVSNVTDMRSMFHGASAFNQPIGSWDVSKVDTMNHMFYNAKAFNQDIRQWNVSEVDSMESMFEGATAFNQPIGSWDVSNVRNMKSMFYGATAFNQDISQWNVNKNTDMRYMFEHTIFDDDRGYDGVLNQDLINRSSEQQRVVNSKPKKTKPGVGSTVVAPHDRFEDFAPPGEGVRVSLADAKPSLLPRSRLHSDEPRGPGWGGKRKSKTRKTKGKQKKGKQTRRKVRKQTRRKKKHH